MLNHMQRRRWQKNVRTGLVYSLSTASNLLTSVHTGSEDQDLYSSHRTRTNQPEKKEERMAPMREAQDQRKAHETEDDAENG